MAIVFPLLYAVLGGYKTNGELVSEPSSILPKEWVFTNYTDVLFDEGSGAIGAFVCGDREIPAERLRQIGPFCVLVRAEPAAGE